MNETALVAKMLVVGVGNPDRGDDAIGPLVVRALARHMSHHVMPDVVIVEQTGDALALIDEWAGRDAVILVDAAATVSVPGRIHRIDLLADELPIDVSLSSTHAFGVADAVALARTLGLLPGRIIVYAIEGATFNPGAPVSHAVAAALNEVVTRVAGELHFLQHERAPISGHD
jgi:hydrogenase maturation protease